MPDCSGYYWLLAYMKNTDYIGGVVAEFEEVFTERGVDELGHLFERFAESKTVDEAHDFFRTKLLEAQAFALREVMPEDGIQWMQEGRNPERKGYTDGFNTCLSQLKINAKERLGISL